MADSSRPVTGYPAPGAYPPPQYGANRNGYPPPQSTTGYAYPPPNPMYHDPYYANRRATFFRRFIIGMVAVFIIFGLIFFIIWLVLRPRVPQFRVDSVSLSNLNISGSQQVSGTWLVRFQVYNPNKKMSVAYDDIETLIYYRLELLAQTRIPPFDQDTRNRTAVEATFSALGSYVDRWVVDAINQDRSRGAVSFNVRLVARVRFRAGGYRPRRRYLRALCQDLGVGVSSNNGTGKMVGGERQCTVDL